MNGPRKRNYWRALKTLLLERAGYRCEYCGVLLEFEGSTVDHVDPHGDDEVSNYRVSCRSCNASKGQKSLEDFRIYEQTLMVKVAMPELGFTTAQVLWLTQQEWFPFSVEPHTFYFERRGTHG